MRVQTLELVVLLLLVFVAVFAAVARRLQTPYPIGLVIAGLILGFVPGIPRINLDPDIVFFVLLPPLLYAAAWMTSWRDFSYNLISILFLAVGLVAFTVAGIALVAKASFPGFDWRLGIVLGALVAPTDAVAATTIARRLGLPRRIVDVLEGESLVNDATGLLALEFGLAMVVQGESPTVFSGVLRLLWVYPGAHLAYFLRRRLLGQKEPTPPLRHMFVVGWTGMRGVIALAAALALPRVLSDGSPFPQRDLIVFLTFGVIVVTLVAQGLTLPAIIRVLGLAGDRGANCEEVDARRIALEAALSHLGDARAKDDPGFTGVYDDLAQHYRDRLNGLSTPDGEDDGSGKAREKYEELTRELLQVEREAALRLRKEGRISDEVLRQLEHDVDLREARYSGGLLD